MIKKYAKNITKTDIMNFCIKEKVNITKNELEIIYNAIHNETEKVLGNFTEFLNKHKNNLSNEVYSKANELYNKYKKFIE